MRVQLYFPWHNNNCSKSSLAPPCRPPPPLGPPPTPPLATPAIKKQFSIAADISILGNFSPTYFNPILYQCFARHGEITMQDEQRKSDRTLKVMSYENWGRSKTVIIKHVGAASNGMEMLNSFILLLSWCLLKMAKRNLLTRQVLLLVRCSVDRTFKNGFNIFLYLCLKRNINFNVFLYIIL